MKSPAFQFYPDDFIGGTVGMTAAEVGAYVRLLCFAWGNGFIPSESSSLKRITGYTVSESVLSKFPGGKNPRMEEERNKQAVWRDKSRIGGLHSAAKRASTTLQPPLQPKVNQPCLQPNGNTPSPSPSPLVERERGFAEIPPMTRAEFDTMAEMSAVPKDCADWFWNLHDARNWIDGHGQPIRKVQPLLMNALKSWRANGVIKKSAGAGFPPRPVVHHLQDATHDCRTPEEIAEQEARRHK